MSSSCSYIKTFIVIFVVVLQPPGFHRLKLFFWVVHKQVAGKRVRVIQSLDSLPVDLIAMTGHALVRNSASINADSQGAMGTRHDVVHMLPEVKSSCVIAAGPLQ